MRTQPLAALVFKIVSDPYVGRLAYFRVYSGKISTGTNVLNSSKGKRERIGRLIRMYADRREDIDVVEAGDIAAVLALKDTFTGETLTDADHPIVLESISFPDPVIAVAVEPKTTADQEKMGEALRKLSEEDPTFQVRSDEATGQTMIAGMGELHLEVLVDRMLREFRVQANVGRPRVAYRESITRAGAQGGPEVRQADRRPRPVRARGDCAWSRRRRARVSCLKTTSSAAEFRRNSSTRPRRAFARPPRAAWWAAIRSWTCMSACTTARRTMWTRTKWPSRRPARWPSKKACTRGGPCCKSRSCRWK